MFKAEFLIFLFHHHKNLLFLLYFLTLSLALRPLVAQFRNMNSVNINYAPNKCLAPVLMSKTNKVFLLLEFTTKWERPTKASKQIGKILPNWDLYCENISQVMVMDRKWGRALLLIKYPGTTSLKKWHFNWNMEREKKQGQMFQVWWVICNASLCCISHSPGLVLLFPKQFINQLPSFQSPYMFLHLRRHVFFP